MAAAATGPAFPHVLVSTKSTSKPFIEDLQGYIVAFLRERMTTYLLGKDFPELVRWIINTTKPDPAPAAVAYVQEALQNAYREEVPNLATA